MAPGEAAKCAQEYCGIVSYVELMALELDGRREVLFFWPMQIKRAEPFIPNLRMRRGASAKIYHQAFLLARYYFELHKIVNHSIGRKTRFLFIGSII